MTYNTPRVLIANRGEIAARIVSAVEALGWESVVVTASDEPLPPCAARATVTTRLPGVGVSAYLDAGALLDAAASSDATMLHPGYGFLSESPTLARGCEERGVTFVGPSPHALELLGDKVSARELAIALDVPVLDAAATLDEARSLAEHGRALMLKAAGGGGGRGMRAVTDVERLDDAWQRASAEAARAFGDDRVYAEELLRGARHIEVQILADGTKAVAVGDRDCSLQRRRQKVIEIAPAITVSGQIRKLLADAAVALAEKAGLSGAATVEFLVTDDRWVFLEVNPRIQVEHPVTEAVSGVDLVVAQLRLAAGASLEELQLTHTPAARGVAIESRVTAERFADDGSPEATTGTITQCDLPNGAGVRVETWIRRGTAVTGTYDPLLAKVITHVPTDDLARAVTSHRATLATSVIDGVETNLPFLLTLLAHPTVRGGAATTSFIDETLPDLLPSSRTTSRLDDGCGDGSGDGSADGSDVVARSVGTVLDVRTSTGDVVSRGDELILVEAMKMEHALAAPCDGVVQAVHVSAGAGVQPGEVLVSIAASTHQSTLTTQTVEVDLDAEREDLELVRAAHRPTLDEARSAAVAKRHATGLRTARENIADLVDEGSFREYGALAVAAQRARRSVEELATISPADGIVTGIARINSAVAEHPSCAVLAYDYTVMAGTQGVLNHKKTDRLLELAHDRKLPVVLFAEGGGGRPGDTDTSAVAGLDLSTFSTMGALRGVVPTIGIAAGRCFAGNAALLGACDIVIATRDANLGMGGPAMIEGGGLGSYSPEQIGPAPEQFEVGVVDVLADDEADAVRTAQALLALLQQPQLADAGAAPDQRRLRHAVPLNRKRAYSVRDLVATLVDETTFLELRGGFGTAALTGLARIDGRTVGIMANDPEHGGGAIDVDAATKLNGFMELCDRHGIPLVSLCDTPGFMVGPDSERRGAVRAFPRLFVAGANLRVPLAVVITRKGYGLGAMAMAGGSFARPVATVAWPTGEIGAMGLEGAVRLGYRRELEAIADLTDRRRLYDDMVAQAYEAGRAINAARAVEIDAVIDPAETRHWIITAFEGA